MHVFQPFFGIPGGSGSPSQSEAHELHLAPRRLSHVRRQQGVEHHSCQLQTFCRVLTSELSMGQVRLQHSAQELICKAMRNQVP